MIRVTHSIALDESEIEETFIRASGPGGQNVNKLSTAVQLRFDVRHSPNLPDGVKARLERLAGSRLTNDGVLVLIAQRHRTQDANRRDALERLVELVRQATEKPKPRRPTRPPMGRSNGGLIARPSTPPPKRCAPSVRNNGAPSAAKKGKPDQCGLARGLARAAILALDRVAISSRTAGSRESAALRCAALPSRLKRSAFS